MIRRDIKLNLFLNKKLLFIQCLCILTNLYRREYQKEYQAKRREPLRSLKIVISRELKNKNRRENRKSERAYYWENRDRILERQRRTNITTRTNNGPRKRIYIANKRPYTGYCEVCGKEQKFKLNYHHWDDNNINKGLWLCVPCHGMANRIDLGHHPKYLELKSKMDQK